MTELPIDPGLPQGWCRALLEASPQGIVVSDEAGRILFANPSLQTMSGYAAGELVGQPVASLVPEAGPGPGGRLRRRDGTLVAVDVGSTSAAAAGRTLTMRTVRNRRPQADGGRARLLQVLDLVPDAVMVIDAATLLVEYANPAAISLTGSTRDDLVGSRAALGRSEVTDEDRDAIVEDLARDPEPVQYVDHVTHARSGEHIPVEMHERVVTDADGSRHVVAVARDLRPGAEQEQLLRTSEKAFRTAFEQAPIGVEVVALGQDGSRSILMANRAMGDMFGCTVPDLIGRNLDEFTFPEDRAVDSALAADLAGGRRTEVSRLKRYRLPGGGTLWTEYRATSVELPDVPGPLALVHMVDVTSRAAEQAHREREAVLSSCVADVSRAVLAGEAEHTILTRIVQGAREILDGAGAALLVADDGTGWLRVDAAAGNLVSGVLHTELDFSGSALPAELVRAETAALPGPPTGTPEPFASVVGPVAVARFGPETRMLAGLLVVVRGPGATPFTPTDAAQLGLLARQTQLAIQLARARADQQRLSLLEERQRIARDLHDGVLQDLIALGMQISIAADRSADPSVRERELERVDQLEKAVRQLRRVVFDLVPATRQPLDVALQKLGREAARVLGHQPRIDLRGPVDALPTEIAADVLSVTREALSNVARHAAAAHTRVALRVGDGLVTLTVDDDGGGVPSSAGRGYGLASIEHRASSRHGRSVLGPGPLGGTRLRWTCPLPDSGQGS